MAFKALVCVGLLCLAVTANAGGTYVKNKGDVYAKQFQYQDAGNGAFYNKGPVNQQSSNQAIQQAGNGNYAENFNSQKISGRKLQGWYYVDNSGDVWAKQGQFQSSGNTAAYNSGPVNQQSSNQAVQQAGNGNSAENYNKQTIKGPEPPKGSGHKGRKLLGDWYWIDNSGDVWAKQKQYQSSGNTAAYNSGPVNQQSSNQAVQQAGNGNSAGNYNKQTIKGRKLLGDNYYVDNSGDVWAKQGQFQSAGNGAYYNSGPVNQQSSNQAVQQAGNGNSAGNYNKQTIKGPEPPKGHPGGPGPNGRKLLGDWYWIDNSGDVWAKQSQYQFSGNVAAYNSGPVNQQSSNQAIQQAGNGNSAENYNSQTIKG